jgi:hypothetical protein
VTAAVVDAADGAPTGVAELWVDGSRIGGQADVADGAVQFVDVALSPGDHEVEVRFLAADGWRDSAQTVQHTVERPPPGEGTPIHYAFDEGQGTTAANSGLDGSVGAATLSGAAGWTPDGKFGAGIDLPGGASGTGNQVKLPDNIDAGMDDQFSVSLWARPNALPTWVPLVQIGSSTDTFFLLQSNTQTNGATGFAATFKAPGAPAQERLVLGQGNDLPLDEWTHVVFTQSGSVGKIYFDGELQATRDDFTLDIGDVGVDGRTTANLLGGTSWPDARWDGQIDDFRMFGYELTAEQVGELHAGTPANAAPVGAADAYGTFEDEPLTVEAPGVLANDTDADGDALTATGLTQPAHGAVVMEADGSFTYTPDRGFVGTDTFTYQASDGTATSAATTVTITVEEAEHPVNTAPEAGDDAYSAVGGEPLMIPAPGVLANDTDADGNVLTAVEVTQPANGEVTLEADGSFTYTSEAGFSGKDVFTYRADDGQDVSAPATVTITVKSPAAPPGGGGARAGGGGGRRSPVGASSGTGTNTVVSTELSGCSRRWWPPLRREAAAYGPGHPRRYGAPAAVPSARRVVLVRSQVILRYDTPPTTCQGVVAVYRHVTLTTRARAHVHRCSTAVLVHRAPGRRRALRQAHVSLGTMTGTRKVYTTVSGLPELARRQHRVVTRAQLAALGVGPRDVAHHVRALRWRELSPTVLALHRGPLTREARWWTAVRGAPRAASSARGRRSSCTASPAGTGTRSTWWCHEAPSPTVTRGSPCTSRAGCGTSTSSRPPDFRCTRWRGPPSTPRRGSGPGAPRRG